MKPARARPAGKLPGHSSSFIMHCHLQDPLAQHHKSHSTFWPKQCQACGTSSYIARFGVRDFGPTLSSLLPSLPRHWSHFSILPGVGLQVLGHQYIAVVAGAQKISEAYLLQGKDRQRPDKRPAKAQQPNLYLEPKWLRYFWPASVKHTSKGQPGTYFIWLAWHCWGLCTCIDATIMKVLKYVWNV